MMRRLFVVLACALAPIALLSACGGGGTHTGPTSGLSIKEIKRINRQDTAKSYAECQSTADNPGLPADQKPLEEETCQYIKTGNNAGLKAVDHKLCELQAKAKPEPERTTLLAQCKTLTPTVPGATTTVTGATP